MTAVLDVQDLVLKRDRPGFDASFAPGDIVGLAGLEGHGQETFLKSLIGLERPRSGRIDLDGAPIGSFHDTVRRGVAYLPRDRRWTGIFPALSVLDNFAISTAGRDTSAGLISASARRARFAEHVRRLSINAPDWNAPITTLSGGNQQKVLLARTLALEPRVLLLNDPTRGVDHATRLTLYEVFRDLAAREGMVLVVLSSEIEEILQLCQSVYVFHDHALAARLDGAAMTTETVISAMFGKERA